MGRRAIDLTGREFGKWTVLCRVGSRDRNTTWLCICECGTERVVLGSSLRSGGSKSCGCVGGGRPLLDLTGQRFGELTVLSRAPDGPGRGQTRWVVQCSCGSTGVVNRAHLRSGSVETCGRGHRRGEDATNWRGSTVGYSAAHYRIRSARGSASMFDCSSCGERAHDWAYQGGGETETWEEVNGTLLAYSYDPSDYEAMCKKCHRELDAANRVSSPAWRELDEDLTGGM